MGTDSSADASILYMNLVSRFEWMICVRDGRLACELWWGGGGVSGWERFSLASVYRSYFTHRTHFALINYWPVNKQDVKWYKLGIHHALGKGLEGTGRGNGSKRTQWESEKGDATITLLPRMKKGGEKSPDWEIQGEKESGKNRKSRDNGSCI